MGIQQLLKSTVDDICRPAQATSPPSDGPPPPHPWAERPDRCRPAGPLSGRGDPAGRREPPAARNLIAPDAIRRLAWSPPDKLPFDNVAEALAAPGARAWLLADELVVALAEPR